MEPNGYRYYHYHFHYHPPPPCFLRFRLDRSRHFHCYSVRLRFLLPRRLLVRLLVFHHCATMTRHVSTPFPPLWLLASDAAAFFAPLPGLLPFGSCY
jgi:hypothetical protein